MSIVSASSHAVHFIVTALICCPAFGGCAPGQPPKSADNGQGHRAINYPPPPATITIRRAGKSAERFPQRTSDQEAVAEFAGLRVECMTNHHAYLVVFPQQRFYLGDFAKQDAMMAAINSAAMAKSDLGDAIKAATSKLFQEAIISQMDLSLALSKTIEMMKSMIGQPGAPIEITRAARLWVSTGTATWRAQLAGERVFVDMTLSAQTRQRLKQALSEGEDGTASEKAE